MGDGASIDGCRRFPARAGPSGQRRDRNVAADAGSIRLARTASRRAHHVVEKARGLVIARHPPRHHACHSDWSNSTVVALRKQKMNPRRATWLLVGADAAMVA